MKMDEKKTGENRSEFRTVLDQFHSVEFSINKEDPIFQFRVRDISPSGMGILINGESKVLNYLKVGLVLQMKFNPENRGGSPETLKTQVRHITLIEGGRCKGQYLVGLLIKPGR